MEVPSAEYSSETLAYKWSFLSSICNWEHIQHEAIGAGYHNQHFPIVLWKLSSHRSPHTPTIACWPPTLAPWLHTSILEGFPEQRRHLQPGAGTVWVSWAWCWDLQRGQQRGMCSPVPWEPLVQQLALWETKHCHKSLSIYRMQAEGNNKMHSETEYRW